MINDSFSKLRMCFLFPLCSHGQRLHAQVLGPEEMMKGFLEVNWTSTQWPGYLQKLLCNDPVSAAHLGRPYGSVCFQTCFTFFLLVPLCQLSKLAAADHGPALSSIWRSEEDSTQIFGSQPSLRAVSWVRSSLAGLSQLSDCCHGCGQALPQEAWLC